MKNLFVFFILQTIIKVVSLWQRKNKFLLGNGVQANGN